MKINKKEYDLDKVHINDYNEFVAFCEENGNLEWRFWKWMIYHKHNSGGFNSSMARTKQGISSLKFFWNKESEINYKSQKSYEDKKLKEWRLIK